jgi:hypothetical protein
MPEWCVTDHVKGTKRGVVLQLGLNQIAMRMTSWIDV